MGSEAFTKVHDLLHELIDITAIGLTPSLLGVTHVVVQFPLYEAIKANRVIDRALGFGTHCL